MMSHSTHLDRAHTPQGLSDRFAYGLTKSLRFFADTFFAKHYGHRAVVLETIAAVPGMVGSTLQHLKALRYMSDDHGWFRTLMDEAENERMHLLTFIEIAKPTRFERWLIILAQWVFYNFFFLAVHDHAAHGASGRGLLRRGSRGQLFGIPHGSGSGEP